MRILTPRYKFFVDEKDGGPRKIMDSFIDVAMPPFGSSVPS